MPLLWQGYERIRRLREALPSRALDALAVDRIDHALRVKEQEFRTALERSLGLEIEAVAAAQSAVRGGTLAVAVSMINHSSHTIALEFVHLQAPSGWEVTPPSFAENPARAPARHRACLSSGHPSRCRTDTALLA